MNIIHLTVENPGFSYMIEGILAFQTEETTEFWSEPLYHFYPQLDKGHASSLPLVERRKYFEEVLESIYEEQKSVLLEKTKLYTATWNQYEPQITAALSEAFEVDCSKRFNNMRCNISLNPIEPRYLDTHTFDVFFLNSEKGFIGEAIHEIIHFIWFHVWQKQFRDSYKEYESPTLKWILSEMVVETIMKDPRLSEINPYFKRENGGCIYPYFFNMKADGAYVLDQIDEMYQKQDIAGFMKSSYAYCLKHENEIREHIRHSEQ